MAREDVSHEELTTPKFMPFSLNTFASTTITYLILLNDTDARTWVSTSWVGNKPFITALQLRSVYHNASIFRSIYRPSIAYLVWSTPRSKTSTLVSKSNSCLPLNRWVACYHCGSKLFLSGNTNSTTNSTCVIKWLCKAGSASGSFIKPITLIRLKFLFQPLGETDPRSLCVCVIVRLVKRSLHATCDPLPITRYYILDGYPNLDYRQFCNAILDWLAHIALISYITIIINCRAARRYFYTCCEITWDVGLKL